MTLHEMYQREHNGTPLTMDIINQMMKGEDNIDISRAMSSVHPNIMDGNTVKIIDGY